MVFVYNGKEFKKIYINRSKVGFKFGEFSLTKKFTKKQDKKKSKKKVK
jgi:ribosomal protein S19